MPISWFQEHLGDFVMRKDPVDSEFRTYQLPENPKCVTFFHELQSHGIQFKPILKIHNRMTECESCSA